MWNARGRGGDSAAASGNNTALETINAAATAIAAVQSRAPQATAVQVRAGAARLACVYLPASISVCWIHELFGFESEGSRRSVIL